ncbi:MAG: YraN family protein [Clostridiales bacterium]|nr:YraN family protein [Clostridiales bacterium]
MAVEKENKDSFHNKKLGKEGEKKARSYLKRRGWKILEKNYKTPFGEIDIIAEKGEVVAFIEVKTRLSDIYGAPSEAVSNERKLRYIRGANYYFMNKIIDCTVRFDIIEVFKSELNHIDNAFGQ